jgi:hypothetical protein
MRRIEPANDLGDRGGAVGDVESQGIGLQKDPLQAG